MKKESNKFNFDDLLSDINLMKDKSKGNKELKELHKVINEIYEQCLTEKEKKEYIQKVKNILIYDVLLSKNLVEKQEDKNLFKNGILK
jgi:hypothetical protein